MGLGRKKLFRKKAVARMTNIWARPPIDWNTRMAIVSNLDVNRPEGYPARIPYCVNGIWLGEIEGDTTTDPGYKEQVFRPGINLPPDLRFFNGQDSVIESTLLWSGDPDVEDLLAEPGPSSRGSRYKGGSHNPKECALLLIHVDKLKPVHSYNADEPIIITYELYWRVSIDPVRRVNNALPEKFKFRAVPLSGTDQKTGKCFPPGMQLAHEYKLNLFGERVDDDGNVIDLTVFPDDYPINIAPYYTQIF